MITTRLHIRALVQRTITDTSRKRSVEFEEGRPRRARRLSLFTTAHISAFSAPTLEEVTAVVRSSPNKHCSTDRLPTWLLKESIAELASFLTTLVTASLETGEFPSTWRHAIIHPHLKKSGLDPSDFNNYRPLEKLVNKRLVGHLCENGPMSTEQSAYGAICLSSRTLHRVCHFKDP